MYVFDFNNAKEGTVKTVMVNPDGWKGPLTIEYCIAQVNKYDTQLSVVWRVKGTKHCFTIYEQLLNVESKSNYKSHFENVLQNFRFDYWTWFNDKRFERVEWKDEYKKEFGRFIIPEREQDHFSECVSN